MDSHVAAAMMAAVLAACGFGADPGTSEAGTDLTVTVRADEKAEPITWRLTCDPAGGDHPDPDAACAALDEAGDPFAEPAPDEVCTMIYGGPQTATIEGRWRGESVQREFSRENGCRISEWDALAPVLEPSGSGQSTQQPPAY